MHHVLLFLLFECAYTPAATCKPSRRPLQRLSSMALKYDEKLTPDLIERVQDIIISCNKSGERISGWETIQQMLLAASLAWHAQVPPEFCGVHPDNRSKLGVSGAEAHHHGFDIVKIGWSWKRASDASAFETPPAPYNKAAQEANDRYVRVSNGYIPPLVQMQILSVGGTHTNTFLRAVKAGCPSAVDKLADQCGKLNLEKNVATNHN